MTRTLFRIAVALTCSSVVIACFGSSSSNGPNGAPLGDAATLDGDDTFPDAESPPVDAGRSRNPPSDAGADATVTEMTDAPEGDAPADDALVVPPVDAAPDAPIPVAGCIPDIPGGQYIFGDHYLRADGELVYGAGGAHTIITNATTSLPLLGITDVDQQIDHACGLRSDGTVWCWPFSSGSGNGNGDLGNGTVGGTQAAGVATEVVTSVPDGGPPSYLTGVTHISSNSDTQYTFPTCAIRSDRTLWCWGYSTAETVGPDGLFWGTTGTTGSLSVATPIAASAGDGGPPPTVLADQVSVGARHACFISQGKVSCWGQNVAGNLGIGNANLSFQPYPVPVEVTNGLPAVVDAIGSGYDYTCALAGGGVWCWGTNNANEIGNPGVPSSICNSNYCIPVPTPVQQAALDGGINVIPDGGVDQAPLVNVQSLHVGYLFACVLDTANTAWCWGSSEGEVTTHAEATAYTDTQVPYADINELTVYGESWTDGLRYVTASGLYVSGTQELTPFCQ